MERGRMYARMSPFPRTTEEPDTERNQTPHDLAPSAKSTAE